MCWTTRTQPIKSLLDNYQAVYDTLEEVMNMGGKAEASRRAPGLRAKMSHFDIFWFTLHGSYN